jgi:hypothetical protein
VIYRDAQFMTKLVKVRGGVGKSSIVEVLVHEDQQLFPTMADSPQVQQEALGDASGGLFEEHLAVADDVVDRGAEVMPDFRQLALAGSARGRTGIGLGQQVRWCRGFT